MVKVKTVKKNKLFEEILENNEIKTLEEFFKVSWVLANSIMEMSAAMEDIVMKSSVYGFLKLNEAFVSAEEAMREYRSTIKKIDLNKSSINWAISQMEKYIDGNPEEEPDTLITSLNGVIRTVNNAVFSVENSVKTYVESGEKPDISGYYEDFKRSVSRFNEDIIDRVNSHNARVIERFPHLAGQVEPFNHISS